MADIGTSTTIAFGTSSYAASVTDIQIGGQERPVIDTSHMGTTGAALRRGGNGHDHIPCPVGLVQRRNSGWFGIHHGPLGIGAA